MMIRKVHFPHLTFYYHRKNKNVFETKKNREIFTVYGNDDIGKKCTVFISQNHSDRLLVIKNDEIKTLIENNPRYPTQDIDEMSRIRVFEIT